MHFTHPAPFTDTGRLVYDRTYSRTQADGTRETWADTVNRVVDGNVALVPNAHLLPNESDDLKRLMYDMKLLPAGRHLWASGVKGRQYLYNCFVSGWDEKDPVSHFLFMFMQLMCGGGVGANYSNRFLADYPAVIKALNIHIVCSEDHADYETLRPYLSGSYSPDWEGAFAIEDSREGWSAALEDLLNNFFHNNVKHLDRVYDVSRVRPSGAPLRGFGGSASGPVPLARMLKHIGTILSEEAGEQMSGMVAMDLDHEIAQCVVAGGVRRSARMSLMHWDDPEIAAFLQCKDDTGDLWTTNISVEVDDKFFSALENDDHGAHYVMTKVTEGMLKNGEPGFWNSTLSSVGEVDEMIATNPCGEIALESWGGCNLGHINMDAFAPTEYGGAWDIEGAAYAHKLMARYLIRATYADLQDPKNRAIVDRSRRIGVGHFGVQGFLAKQGIKFSEAPSDYRLRADLTILRDMVREEARAYAFKLRIPEPIKVTTVAPTGTIAKLAGRSEGIHPIYARHFLRRIRFSKHDAAQMQRVEQYRTEGYDVQDDMYAADTVVVSLPTKDLLVEEVEALGLSADIVESADEITLRDQLRFQAMYQRYYADNAVSFTANIAPDTDPDTFRAVLEEMLPYLKGTTVFPDMSRPQSPYERITKADYELYEVWLQGVDSGDEECRNGVCPVK